MNRDKFIKEANSILIGMAPHVASRKTAIRLKEATEELSRECGWRLDSDGYYQTECINGWSFDNGGIKENGLVYCPYCGGIIIENS